MNAVAKMQRKKPWPGILFPDRFINPVRYAFAILSFLLVAGFLVEQDLPDELPGRETVATSAGPEEMLLNSESFHRSLGKPGDEGKISLYACVVRCLHTGQGDCTDCSANLSKYNLHETN
jgi:hypothetical protein